MPRSPSEVRAPLRGPRTHLPYNFRINQADRNGIIQGDPQQLLWLCIGVIVSCYGPPDYCVAEHPVAWGARHPSYEYLATFTVTHSENPDEIGTQFHELIYLGTLDIRDWTQTEGESWRVGFAITSDIPSCYQFYTVPEGASMLDVTGADNQFVCRDAANNSVVILRNSGDYYQFSDDTGTWWDIIVAEFEGTLIEHDDRKRYHVELYDPRVSTSCWSE